MGGGADGACFRDVQCRTHLHSLPSGFTHHNNLRKQRMSHLLLFLHPHHLLLCSSSYPIPSEKHQPSVKASPGSGDALVCRCSSVFCSEGSELAGSDHSVLWYVWTSLPTIPLCVSLLLHVVTVHCVLDGLRRILCQVGLQKGPEGENSSLVDRLMLNDSKMWKGNRTYRC